MTLPETRSSYLRWAGKEQGCQRFKESQIGTLGSFSAEKGTYRFLFDTKEGPLGTRSSYCLQYKRLDQHHTQYSHQSLQNLKPGQQQSPIVSPVVKTQVILPDYFIFNSCLFRFLFIFLLIFNYKSTKMGKTQKQRPQLTTRKSFQDYYVSKSLVSVFGFASSRLLYQCSHKQVFYFCISALVLSTNVNSFFCLVRNKTTHPPWIRQALRAGLPSQCPF